MLDTLSSADFRPRIGEAFRLTPPEGEPIDAVLVEVTDHDNGDPAPARAPFSVFFNAPMGTAAPQAIFGVEHAELDRVELFLVPVGRDDAGDGMLYEAVFG